MSVAEAEQLVKALLVTIEQARPMCPEREGGGAHEFTADLEYDSTGKTVNCEHCGEVLT
jgi:hypothetical protein